MPPPPPVTRTTLLLTSKRLLKFILTPAPNQVLLNRTLVNGKWHNSVNDHGGGWVCTM